MRPSNCASARLPTSTMPVPRGSPTCTPISTPPSSPPMAGRRDLTMVHCWSGCSTSTSRGTEQAAAATPNNSGTWRRGPRRGTFWAHRALCRRASTRAREGARADAVAHSPCGEARAGTRSVGWSGAGARSPRGEARRRGRTPRGRVGAGCTLPYGRRGAGWRPGGPWPAEVHAPLREARRRLEARRPLAGGGARSLAGGAEHSFSRRCAG